MNEQDYAAELAKIERYGDKIKSPTAEQGSPEWLEERHGFCTASRFADVLDHTKAGKEGSKRAKYRMECVIERLTGKSTERFVTAAMQWGTEQEPFARMAYEEKTGYMVEQTGFQHHLSVKWCGGSVDGLVGNDGIIEIKCPTSPVHLDTMLTDSCEHYPQIQGYLWITGRYWCDFISFDPRMPEGLDLYIQRIDRDASYINMLSDKVINFLAEVEQQYNALIEIKRERIGAQQNSESVRPAGTPSLPCGSAAAPSVSNQI